MKRVIVQGDDWGYKTETNIGIEHAYENGILTQTVVMANLLDVRKKSEYKDRIDRLENQIQLEKPALGIGVHLNLTYGKPLSSSWPQSEFNRPLKGSGKPEEWQGSTWQNYFSQFTASQVEIEYRKQIEFVIDVFGGITHLDSHQMVASYEPMTAVYEKLALEYDVPIRPVAPLSEKPVYGGDFIVDNKVNHGLQERGIKMADKNIFKLFFNEKIPVESFLDEINAIEEGQTIEVMFHPAKGENADGWRLTDLETLTSQKVLSYFKDSKIELINYGSI